MLDYIAIIMFTAAEEPYTIYLYYTQYCDNGYFAEKNEPTVEM